MIDLWQIDSRFGLLSVKDTVVGGRSDFELAKVPRYRDLAGTAADDDEAQFFVDGVTFSADQGGSFTFQNGHAPIDLTGIGPKLYFRSGAPVSLALFLPVGKGKPLLYSVECIGNFSLYVLYHLVRYGNRQPTSL